jgi:hypothetical protein
MADEDAPPNDVINAAHAAIGGVQAALENVVGRLDTIAATQAATLDHLIRLQPAAAVETELGGTVDALNPTVDPPAVTPNDPEHVDSPLRKFHNVLG